MYQIDDVTKLVASNEQLHEDVVAAGIALGEEWNNREDAKELAIELKEVGESKVEAWIYHVLCTVGVMVEQEHDRQAVMKAIARRFASEAAESIRNYAPVSYMNRMYWMPLIKQYVALYTGHASQH